MRKEPLQEQRVETGWKKKTPNNIQAGQSTPAYDQQHGFEGQDDLNSGKSRGSSLTDGFWKSETERKKKSSLWTAKKKGVQRGKND